MNKSSGKYYFKRGVNDTYADITSMFNGVAVLSIDGMNTKGDAINVYSEQWIDSQKEDCIVTTQDENDNDVVIRKNVDLSITIIVSRRYASENIDVQTTFESFVDYVCGHGAFFVRSLYANREAQVVCLKGCKPTTTKLNRGVNSFILATLELHVINVIQTVEPVVLDKELYIGFGNSTLGGMQDILDLSNVQHHTFADDVSGNYSAQCPSTSYLWICSSMVITSITSGGFVVPMNDNPVTINNLYCYRSGNAIRFGVMNITIRTN